MQMCEGGALENENDELQEQVAELQEEVFRLNKSPFQANRSPQTASAAEAQAFTEAGCLLELSDNARLVLAAYAVSLRISYQPTRPISPQAHDSSLCPLVQLLACCSFRQGLGGQPCRLHRLFDGV
jgi:hypothetical protein